MKLNRLLLQNFRQHKLSSVEFDSGVTGIMGPNGAGKSTILEAIAWALYGNPAARGMKDGIRFQRAEPRSAVSVELDFELAGHRYRVVRGLANAELYLDGGELPIANTIKGVSEVLHRRLGMTHSEFFNTYFTGQKELNVMAAMKPTERAQFLSRVLGYEKLRVAQDLVRDRRKLVVAEIGGLRSGMRDPEAVARLISEAEERRADALKRLDEAENFRLRMEANMAELAPRWEKAQLERDRLQEILSELRVAESEELGLQREGQRIGRELGDVETAKAELQLLSASLAPMGEVDAELERLEALARQEGRRRALLESVKALEEEMVRMRERYGRVEGAPALEEEVTSALERARAELVDIEGTLEARRTEWVRDRQEAETKRQALLAQYFELREQREKLVALGDEGTCPTCMRPLRESFRTVLEILDSQMETVVVDGNYYKSRLEQLEVMPEEVRLLDERRRVAFHDVGNLERRLANVQHGVLEKQQLMRELGEKDQRLASQRDELGTIPGGYDQARHDQVRSEMERLTGIEQRAARLAALIEKEPQLHEERARSEEARRSLTERLAQLVQKRDAFGFVEKEFIAVRTAHEFSAAQLHQAEVASATMQSEFTGAQQLLVAALREREELLRSEEQLRTLVVQRRMHDELDRTFSDLRTDLNFQLRPELSELASTFLRDLTDGRYTELELDDSYRIVVLEEGIPKPVISGGEEDLANLSLRLAISQMIAERSGQEFSLLVLDEIFGSLDDRRRRSVLQMLPRIRDRFEQVILITHVNLEEGLDRAISVNYDEVSGASVVNHVDRTDVEYIESIVESRNGSVTAHTAVGVTGNGAGEN